MSYDPFEDIKDPQFRELMHRIPMRFTPDNHPYQRYNGWGPGEDYMAGLPKEDKLHSWNDAIQCNSWKEFYHDDGFVDIILDFNYIASFYFEAFQDSQDCCNGYNDETNQIINSISKEELKDHTNRYTSRYTLGSEKAKALGVYGFCERCEGTGYVTTSPLRLRLIFWLLHPRKGASRGVIVDNITEADFPEIKEFLRTQWKENHQKIFQWALED